jgi:two-component system, NarL family, response regulator NreC
MTMTSETRVDPIRVCVADDHAVVRTGLRAVLGAARDIAVVGEAKDGREAVALAEQLKPDVIVMDLSMGDLDGIAATKAIVDRGLPTRVLVLTVHAEEDWVLPALEAGAAGYVMKSAADRELVTAVRMVARGDVYVASEAARVVAREFAARESTRKKDLVSLQ